MGWSTSRSASASWIARSSSPPGSAQLWIRRLPRPAFARTCDCPWASLGRARDSARPRRFARSARRKGCPGSGGQRRGGKPGEPATSRPRPRWPKMDTSCSRGHTPRGPRWRCFGPCSSRARGETPCPTSCPPSSSSPSSSSSSSSWRFCPGSIS